MGLGQSRVPCSFPAAAWSKLVMGAVQACFPDPNAADAQQARKNIEVLLRHLQQTGTRRNGRLADREAWVIAATSEHAAFPFGGIVVRTSATRQPYLVAADQIADEVFPAWTPPAPPVARRPRELANALAPVLRCATQLRFVDPYFDADVAAFFDPMREYLLVAQNRRSVGDLRIQIHFAVSRDDVGQLARIRGQRVSEEEVAKIRLDACDRRIRPILHPGVTLRAFAWGEGPRGERMHNRYLLTDVGGIAVQHGLDRSAVPETDDLTVLSKEQYEERWAEYSAEGAVRRLIADCRFAGAPAGK